MRVWASPRWLLVALMLAAGCDEPDATEPVTPQSGELEEADLEGTVVYESQWVRTPDGEVVDFVETGVWTPDLAERVARPWLHTVEGVLHDETSWFEQDDDGTVVAGYRVTMRIVEPVPPALGEPPVSVISEDLQQAIASGEPGPLSIAIELELPPPPPLPFLPHRTTVSTEDYAAAIEARRDAAAVQEAAFEASTAELVVAVGNVGGTVEGFLGTIGFLVASVPMAAIETLAEHADVRHIARNGAGGDGTDPVPLGDLRTYTGVQAFHDLGYDGQLPGWGTEMRLGIMETQPLEDEACFLGDNNCTPNHRLNGRFSCSSSGCSYLTDFDDTDYPHGTWVTSIAIADYTQGQATGHESSIAPGLSNWQSPASGGGKEVEIQYYAALLEAAKAKAYDCARGIGPTQCDVMDALNQSNGEPDAATRCNPTSFLPVEAAMENAWDDGVLPVVITHNDNNYPNDDVCRVFSPADMPKALSIGGIDPDDSAPYSSWAYWNQSNRGGGTSKIGLINHANAMSMVDLVASVLPGYVTGPDGTYGIIDVDGPYQPAQFPLPPTQDAGTSFAAPQVAAASLLVMHRYFDLGLTWIASPGRLHAAMLAQGDRATLGTGGATIPTCISGSRILCGADRYFGLGRLTLRPHNLVWEKTTTFTSSSAPSKDIAFGPIPAGYDIVKCTMQQREDMMGPNKTDISHIRLRVQVRSPNLFGGCAVDYKTPDLTRDDAAPDVKHMVTVLDSGTNIEGRCIQVTQEKLAISTAGAVTVHTHCVADDQLDY